MKDVKWWRGAAALLLVLTMVAGACSSRSDEDTSSGGGDDSSSDEGSSDGDSEEVQYASAEDCTTYEGTQGVTDAEILIGNSLPQSGLYSVFDQVRKGIQGYFDYKNSEGGVEGRDLVLKSLDDAYLPERTRQNVETLVGTEGVFAMVGNVGTENNQQAQQYLEEQGLCVPNLAVSSGFPGFGDPEQDPWIINGLPNYALESIAFADYLKENAPSAKVAILSQNDSFGESYVTAFEKAIEGTDITVVGNETFDPKTETNPQGQVTTLSGSGADTLLLGVTSLPCPNALKSVKDSGWAPLTYVTLTCSSKVLMDVAADAAEGTLSTRATYDPADPSSQSEAAVVAFKEQGAAAGLSPADLDELNVAAGWNAGAYLAQLLEASPELDRASVMNTAWYQKDVTYGLFLDGLTWNTNGQEDPFGITQLQFVKRTGGQWVPEGELVDYSEQLRSVMGD
jgi:branched-chain amino acid transport system substrate-binding protein